MKNLDLEIRIRLGFRIFLILFFLNSCVDESQLQNPFDPNTPSSAWKPSDLKIEALSSNSVKLSWQQKKNPISGFEIIKIFSGAETSITVDAKTLEYSDTEIWKNGQACSKVSYRIRALAGQRASEWVEAGLQNNIPASSSALAGDDQTSGQITLTLNASEPLPWEKGTWSILSGTGGSLSAADNKNAVFTGQPVSLYSLRWTITGPCGTTTDDIQLATGVPVVTTNMVSEISSVAGKSGGSVTGIGVEQILEKGLCWGTTPNPTVAQSKIAFGSGGGSFTQLISGLSAGTTWYVRAYAITPILTIYGNQVSFTTLPPLLPSVQTLAINNINAGAAIGIGEVTTDGGALISSRGICWATSSGPTINSSKTLAGTGVGNFSALLNSLNTSTQYYVRAFATNSVGTSYGNELNFITPDLPSVTTKSSSNVQPTSIVIEGEVTKDGGDQVTERGVTFGTSTLPVISGSKITAGSGVGVFSTSISGLTSGNTYYIRSYATNSWGTAYSSQVIITTPLVPPDLISPINSVTLDCCIQNLIWSTVSGASEYEVQISKSNTFTGTIFSQSECISLGTLGVSSHITKFNSVCISTGTSGNNGIWYWRVRGIKNSVPGIWSQTGAFNYRF